VRTPNARLFFSGRADPRLAESWISNEQRPLRTGALIATFHRAAPVRCGASSMGGASLSAKEANWCGRETLFQSPPAAHLERCHATRCHALPGRFVRHGRAEFNEAMRPR
jgi:hypothetical protein